MLLSWDITAFMLVLTLQLLNAIIHIWTGAEAYSEKLLSPRGRYAVLQENILPKVKGLRLYCPLWDYQHEGAIVFHKTQNIQFIYILLNLLSFVCIHFMDGNIELAEKSSGPEARISMWLLILFCVLSIFFI